MGRTIKFEVYGIYCGLEDYQFSKFIPADDVFKKKVLL